MAEPNVIGDPNNPFVKKYTTNPTPTTSSDFESFLDTNWESLHPPTDDVIRHEELADVNNPTVNDALKETFLAFGKGFVPAANFADTNQRIADVLGPKYFRDNNPPAAISELECRIGGSKFFIPPVNINVSQQFKAGAIQGSAIRQQSSPKFNTGHTETVITMSIYFPAEEAVLGYSGDVFDIDFDNDPEEKVDSFLSSLRGLIAQFKYAPFLPIKNAYLNRTFGITGVVLHSMTISTVDNYPGAISANLTLLKFNHKVYIPMAQDFDQAIHWGKFRQYMGRAVRKLDSLIKPFVIWQPSDQISGTPTGAVKPSVKTAADILAEVPTDQMGGIQTFSDPSIKISPSYLDFYYPFHTPSRIDLPNLDSLKNYDVNRAQKPKDWWEQLLGILGVDVNTYPSANRTKLEKLSAETGYVSKPTNEYKLLSSWLNKQNLTLTFMGPSKLEEYISKRMKEDGIRSGTPAAGEIRNEISDVWFYQMYKSFQEDPVLSRALASQDYIKNSIVIQEWEIPMIKLNLDRNKAIIQGISVSIGNTVSRLQLQMQDEPTHQHIGGQDTRVDISIRVMGEDELIRLENMFSSINGLARIEHGHGVLGFLGIENTLVRMCGVKYVIPLSFEVDTIPGYPHVYDVRLSLTDFDVFQQKREILSAEQQAELIQAFSKRNPFFRVKQLWGMFNAYPDFPLEVRDPEGKIVGHLDPDFYFRSFRTIDDDLIDPPPPPPIEDDPRLQPGHDFVKDEGVHICFGKSTTSGDSGDWCSISDHGITLWSNNEAQIIDAQIDEPHAGNMITQPYVEGLTPASGYVKPYITNNDPFAQYKEMMKDLRYRDKSGSMIRAYPTYMLWLIDEGGTFAGIKMFDNFYGLQSVLDFSVVQSEDILGDTLVLRVSNLYSRLSTKFKDYLDEDIYSKAKIINQQTKTFERMLTGLSDYLVQLDTIDIRPGVRVHMRMGYSANPNALETVFNGVITEVEQGEVITITAQSDAIELGAMVNSSDKNGSSGMIDGNLFGLYLSEPRDLMVTLLTIGSSVAKEVIANATQGVIFSENRYGIRHFGMMLYQPLSQKEIDNNNKRAGKIKDRVDILASQDQNETRSVVSFEDMGYADIVRTLWSNLAAKEDYEVFKRNIYPGNGVGIAQYMGGDIGDVGLTDAIAATGVNPDGTFMNDSLTGQPIESVDPRLTLAAAVQAETVVAKGPSNSLVKEQLGSAVGTGVSGIVAGPAGLAVGGGIGGVGFTNQGHNFLAKLGLVGQMDDDGPFDEVSFRAQTYTKTVWDLFKVCAGLQPDYIVAVRPFEDRSTIFYGKPHWLYTSGLIPLTTGNPNPPPLVQPDDELSKIYADVEARMAQKDNVNVFQQYADTLSSVSSVKALNTSDPNATTKGLHWDPTAGSILSQPTSLNGENLPETKGTIVMEMHLPTDGDLEKDKAKHLQLPSLPPQVQHPFYMDRINPNKKGKAAEGGVGGVDGNNKYDPNGAVKKGDDGSWPGKNPGGLTDYLTPESEQWYMNMRWSPSSGWYGRWKDARILVYSDATGKGVVCTPGDYGPGTNHAAGVSPDTYFSLGSPTTSCTFRVMPAGTPLGPVDFSANKPATQEEKATAAKIAGRFGENVDDLLPTGTTSSALPKASVDPKSIPSWAKGNADIAKFSYDNGYKLEGIPVDFSEASPDERGGFNILDEAGSKAYLVYQNTSRKDQANQIWDEFRKYFPNDSGTKDAFKKSRVITTLPDDVKDRVQKDIFDKLTQEFMKFMWQTPFARGWVVKVVNKRVDTEESAAYAFGAAGGLVGLAAAAVIDSTNILDANRKWDFGAAYSLFKVFIEEGKDAALEYMKSNNGEGKDQENLLMRGLEDTGRAIKNVTDTISQVVDAVTTTASGLLSFMRLSLAQMSHGLSMASNMQKQTNMLNRAFNDSIYYQLGTKDGKIVNQLLYLADNPFTREYAEPVVEVRQPFQRIHTIGSFQHILDNKIIESTDQVATVVTAISNGKHPQTVHFDKGAPSHMQKEKIIETGLYWDHPKGWFGLRKLINPIQTARYYMKSTGSGTGGDATSDETSSKRIGLYNLKESLKDIYQGEITVLGDPSIRPHDLVYLGDVFESMYGFFEVEQVIHHFTPETGFITAITPNACVSINDPARFSLLSYWKAQNHIQAMRNHVRHVLKAQYDNEPAVFHGEYMSIDDVVDKLDGQLQGSLQYTGGGSAVVKSIVSYLAGGAVTSRTAKLAEGTNIIREATIPLLPFASGLILPLKGAWGAWEWVRDNLLDQHGCYVQYLTHNGGPMDAGLSYNQGVAVGQMYAYGIILKSLKIGELSALGPDGFPRVRTQDVIKSVTWDERGPNEAAAQVDMFIDQTNALIRQESGRGSDGFAGTPNEVYLAKINRVVDGDTFHCDVLGQFSDGKYTTGALTLGAGSSEGTTIRLAAIDAPEDPFKTDPTVAQEHFDHEGVQATAYARAILTEGRLVALRVVPSNRFDQFGRCLAFVFHASPEGVDSQDFMLKAAGGWPEISWDAYIADGQPYTFNWQMILTGHADVFTNDLIRSIAGRGVEGGG